MKSKPHASVASQLDAPRRAEYLKSEEYLATPDWLKAAAEHDHMLSFYMAVRSDEEYAKAMVKRYKPSPDHYNTLRAAT